jgi:hypothetical protein
MNPKLMYQEIAVADSVRWKSYKVFRCFQRIACDVLVTQEDSSVVERAEIASFNLYASNLFSLTFGRLNYVKIVEPGIM